MTRKNFWAALVGAIGMARFVFGSAQLPQQGMRISVSWRDVKATINKNYGALWEDFVPAIDAIRGKLSIYESPLDGRRFFDAYGYDHTPMAAVEVYLYDPADKKLLDGGSFGGLPLVRAYTEWGKWKFKKAESGAPR
jgi:hypothetical protein